MVPYHTLSCDTLSNIPKAFDSAILCFCRIREDCKNQSGIVLTPQVRQFLLPCNTLSAPEVESEFDFLNLEDVCLR